MTSLMMAIYVLKIIYKCLCVFSLLYIVQCWSCCSTDYAAACCTRGDHSVAARAARWLVSKGSLSP